MMSLGIPTEAESFNVLIAAYSQKHRHYHTASHIDHCLQELDSASGIALEPAEVELALWFHDAVYNPYAAGNEERSADLACALLMRNGVRVARVERVRSLILATRHEASAVTADAQLVVDIDLSILGAGVDAYAAFEANVRKEYRWVPSFLFRKKRAKILESFLARPQIYSMESFRSRYELQARRNLTQAIIALCG